MKKRTKKNKNMPYSNTKCIISDEENIFDDDMPFQAFAVSILI